MQFDFSTPMGKMMFGMIALLAEWYLDNLSQETTKGKSERARKGDWNGTLPFGYTTLARLRQMLADLTDSFRAGQVTEDDFHYRATLIEGTIQEHSELVHGP